MLTLSLSLVLKQANGTRVAVRSAEIGLYVTKDLEIAKQSALIHLLYGEFRALSTIGRIKNCQTLQITIWLLSGWI